jgi:hypothetical protein
MTVLNKLYYDQQKEQMLKDLEEKQRIAQEKIARDGKMRAEAKAKKAKEAGAAASAKRSRPDAIM